MDIGVLQVPSMSMEPPRGQISNNNPCSSANMPAYTASQKTQKELPSFPLVPAPAPPTPAVATPPLRNGTIIKGIRGRSLSSGNLAKPKPTPSYKLRERPTIPDARWAFIVNGTKLAEWDQLSPNLLKQLKRVEWRVYITRTKGHARTLAERAARSGADLIAAVGGDGTLNEVVDGIMRAGVMGPDGLPKATVTVLPLGTASDFCRSMAWTPNDFEEAMWRIGKRGDTAILDVGRLVCDSPDGPVERHFINVASCGASARAAMRLKKFRWLGERARYRMAALSALFKYRPRTLGLRIDGGEWRRVKDASLVAVGNGGYFGHGLNICPDANPYDGKLQVVTASKMGPLAFMMHSWRLRMGKHLDLKGVEAQDVHTRVEVALWNQRGSLPSQVVETAAATPSPNNVTLRNTSSVVSLASTCSPATPAMPSPNGSFTAATVGAVGHGGEPRPRFASPPSSPATTNQEISEVSTDDGGSAGFMSQQDWEDGSDSDVESTDSWPRARGHRHAARGAALGSASPSSGHSHRTESVTSSIQADVYKSQSRRRVSKSSSARSRKHAAAATKSDGKDDDDELNADDFGPVPVEVDGEVVGHAPFAITILPGAIKFRVQGNRLQ